MRQPDSPRFTRPLGRDLRLIGDFAATLRRHHYAPGTVYRYQLCITTAARTFRLRRRSIATLRRLEVPAVVRRSFGSTPITQRMARSALHAWLKFLGRFRITDSFMPWQRWLDDYAGFLETDRGLAPISRYQYLRVARRYLQWQFGRKAAVWKRARPDDSWRYAARLQRAGYDPRSLNTELCILRQFLRFVHVRGACSPLLAKAVPSFSERGRLPRSDVTSEAERRKFLNSFDRHTPAGTRDYAMAVCMLDLGLRCIEVVRLRLGNIDWDRATLTVPPAKGGRGRVLPLPRHVASALRGYVRVRPTTGHEILFVGIVTLVGRPVTNGTVSSAMERAYRRGGINRHGTHRLRHSFATRLLRGGANMKEIADLLGHRLLKTTNRYTHADPHDLRTLVRPWPE